MQEYFQLQRIKQLNQAIDLGLRQLNAGNKIPSSDVYTRMIKKISNLDKGVN